MVLCIVGLQHICSTALSPHLSHPHVPDHLDYRREPTRDAEPFCNHKDLKWPRICCEGTGRNTATGSSVESFLMRGDSDNHLAPRDARIDLGSSA